jgi:hypothetical protein
MSAKLDKHGKPEAHGGYEHQDVGFKGIFYALIGLAVFCLVVHFLVTGLYRALDRFSDSETAPMSPLIANVPSDVRHVPKDYPQAVFPNPKLEEDEVGQFKSILAGQEETLNSYGWVDEKAGVARIPIDQAMNLIAQRGLPVHGSEPSTQAPSVPAGGPRKTGKK